MLYTYILDDSIKSPTLILRADHSTILFLPEISELYIPSIFSEDAFTEDEDEDKDDDAEIHAQTDESDYPESLNPVSQDDDENDNAELENPESVCMTTRRPAADPKALYWGPRRRQLSSYRRRPIFYRRRYYYPRRRIFYRRRYYYPRRRIFYRRRYYYPRRRIFYRRRYYYRRRRSYYRCRYYTRRRSSYRRRYIGKK
ncbi:unnamed protein product [Porites lobata]|uniref:Uncharacterized protein n=1 Tax=Porites lobata TaxID=104759 RepID=A0ABN8NXS9_9CNID|nr:unnamed protein product [Porites lobata]